MKKTIRGLMCAAVLACAPATPEVILITREVDQWRKLMTEFNVKAD